MVLEHMLTVGRDPRNWQAHSKDFSLQLSLSKRSFTSLLFWAYSKIPFSETIPFFPFDHSRIRLMRPLQEVQDIGQLRPLWNKEDFYRALQWWKLQRLKTSKTRRIWRFWRISRLVWPRKATLMELVRLLKLSIPEIKVCRRKTRKKKRYNSKFFSRKP